MNPLIKKKVDKFKKQFPNAFTEGNYLVSQDMPKYSLRCDNFRAKDVHRINKKHLFSINLPIPSYGKMFGKSIYKINTLSGEVIKDDKLLTVKSCRDMDLVDILLTGETYEYMIDHPYMWNMEIGKDFNSFKEFKIFMGFDFYSNKQFKELIVLFQDTFGIYPFINMLYYENKKNIYPLLTKIEPDKSSIFVDYISLCNVKNKPLKIYSSPHKIEELHDQMVYEDNVGQLENKNKRQVAYLKPTKEGYLFTEVWDNIIPIKYKHLNSEYLMWEEAIKQKNCLGTIHSDQLSMNSYFSILYEGHLYDMQINPNNGTVVELKGYNNKFEPPKQLVDLLINSDINYKHLIVNENDNVISGDYITYNQFRGINQPMGVDGCNNDSK